MEKITGVLIMEPIEMLQFLVFIRVHQLILIILKKFFLVLGEGPTEGIDGSVGVAEKKSVLTLIKQRQHLA